MKEKKKLLQKYSLFQIIAFILTIILIVAIIVQIGVMIYLKIKTDELKDKNDEITSQINQTAPTESWMIYFEEQIISINKRC